MRLNHFLFFFFFLSLQTVFAQFPYSTSSKKAIKLFEKGQKAPTELRNPQTGAPNYQEGILLLRPQFLGSLFTKSRISRIPTQICRCCFLLQKSIRN
jgi:hypothetical protein